MKKTLLSLFLSLQFLHLVNSQTVFSEFKIPAFGTTVKVKVNNFTGSPGNPGIGQVWDFSKETYPNEPATGTIVDPKTTPYSSSFPTATHAQTTLSGGISYTKLSKTEYSILGINNSSGMMIYTDPMTLMRPPIRYSETQRDNFKGSYGDGSPMVKIGSYEITYDGFGTLITPNGRYSDVIRFKATQIDIDSLNMVFEDPDLSYKQTVVTTSYSYYINGYSNPLFAIMNSKNNGVDFINVSMLYDPLFLSGKDALLKNMHVKVSPNPAKDFINVDISKADGKYFEVTIIDQLGAEVYKDNISGFEQDVYRVDLNSFEKGTYMMKISNDETYMVEKIIVQ